MTLITQWVNWSVDLACHQGPSFWSGARMILSDQHVSLKLDDTITPETVGYTSYKLGRLYKQYYVPESFDTATMLHARNVKRRKYASASFSTSGHLLKATDENRSKRGSVMGPCLLDVVLTLKPHEKRTAVHVYYRTTEVFKKLPADFIFLRQILQRVPGQDQFPIVNVDFFFANLTVHPMYIATILPHVPDAIATLELIRDRNRPLWSWSGKWLARYLIGGAAGRSIEKFAQAQRTAMASVEMLAGPVGDSVVRYLCDHRAHFMPSRTRFTELNEAFNQALNRVNKETR